ncbi:TetR family transcriptional regulator [Actinocrinis puniceicyclus]|uniref:TetR family transcriptional regulator n=1 Tax=Actinocrinis puniceicyclus TaxID=977794 RepID=A0A8J7WTM8_9ACTN|nr:TetR/AcrR family transcriptional regulator [Actinocrinis puniceicyclus]MBS2965792.1 TetR family transcriptional regulator [Actinocrinis puniceicyclus]
MTHIDDSEIAGGHPELAGRRSNQKLRTRAAVVAAARELMRGGGEVTMPAVARAALVSEATAYRYFPDLSSLLREAFAGLLPDPAEAMAPLAGCADPVRRIEHATRFLLGHVLSYQGAVRALVSGALTRRDGVQLRAGLRFGLIDGALAPLGRGTDPEALAALKRDLALVVSAEALFNLIDLCGLPPHEAVDSAVHAARALTRAALDAGLGPSVSGS